MRTVLCLAALPLIAMPLAAIAETGAAALPPLPAEPSVEARLVPAVIPSGAEDAGLDEWEPTRLQIAAIVGPDGAARGSFRMAETFDDRQGDPDALLAEAEYAGM